MTPRSQRFTSVAFILVAAFAIVGVGLAANGASAHHNADRKGGPKQSTTTTSTTSTTTVPDPGSTVTVTLVIEEQQDDAQVDARAPRPLTAMPDAVTVSEQVPLPTGSSRQCTLTAAEGSDGLAVLEAAQSSGCIESYRVVGSHYDPTVADYGSFLVCLDGTCDENWGAISFDGDWILGRQPDRRISRWWSHLDGQTNIRYLEEFAAAEGDVLGLRYRAHVMACAPSVNHFWGETWIEWCTSSGGVWIS